MASSDNELIDHDVFGQILDMDEEGDNEFSRSIVYNYFEQAENTFSEMDAALKQGDLPNLSRLGHFLKGSSAALGVKNVKTMCERIQHYGSLKDDTGVNPIEEEEAIKLISTCLETAKEEYYTANSYLKDFYEELEEEEEEEEEGGEEDTLEEEKEEEEVEVEEEKEQVEEPLKEEVEVKEVPAIEKVEETLKETSSDKTSDTEPTTELPLEKGSLEGDVLPETTTNSA